MPKLGHITGSRIGDYMTGGRDKAQWGKTSKGVALRIAAEQLGIVELNLDQYTSASMEWGNNNEAGAIEAYETQTFTAVHGKQDFCQHPDYEHIGCTPDALVGDSGILEVKCPYNQINHLKNVISGYQTKQYMPQLQLELWVTGRDWCDFVSFDPRIEGPRRLYVQRILPDAEYIDKMESRYSEFTDIVEGYKEKLGNQEGVNK